MDKHAETLETLAELPAEEALDEFDFLPPDDPDDYADQCNYAGCYPWLADFICAHPHDTALHAALHGNFAAEDDADF
jgi:hypothetical protein